MASILLRFASTVFLILLATFAVGVISWLGRGVSNPADPSYMLHIYLGLLSGIGTLGVHCLVFIYFLGTGRWVKEVALAYGIPDEPWPRLTRDLKRRTFPPALFAMLVPIATSAAGAGVTTLGWPWYVHGSLAVATLLTNLWAFVVEYRCVVTNARVIDEVLLEVDRIRAAHGLPTNAEALEALRQENSGTKTV